MLHHQTIKTYVSVEKYERFHAFLTSDIHMAFPEIQPICVYIVNIPDQIRGLKGKPKDGQIRRRDSEYMSYFKDC